MVERIQAAYVIRIVTQKFDAETSDSRDQQFGNDFGRTLSDGIEQRIPATNVCHQWMINARTIPQFDLMRIAGATTVCLVCAR